jgi:hypothetical protein
MVLLLLPQYQDTLAEAVEELLLQERLLQKVAQV